MIWLDKYFIYILVFLNVVLLVTGQFLWKIGVENLPKKDFFSIALSVFTPYIFCGIAIFGVATVIWLWIISKAGSRLSVIYPLQSIVYVLFALGSMILFKEKIFPTGWVGIGLITLGVILVSWK